MSKIISAILVLLYSISVTEISYAVLRDPTRPQINEISKAGVGVPLFELHGIIIAKNRKIAVINGLNKSVGDEILGERIVAIEENSVQLTGPGGKITLFLLGKPVKRLSPNGS